ncbi:hypothetical protein D3C84_866150 [compost metagenome]
MSKIIALVFLSSFIVLSTSLRSISPIFTYPIFPSKSLNFSLALRFTLRFLNRYRPILLLIILAFLFKETVTESVEPLKIACSKFLILAS